MKRSCEIDGNYRYLLHIPVQNAQKKVLFVLCNPSTADEMKDDPTTRNLQKWALHNDIGTVIVANLYAYRSPTRDDLKPLSRAEAVGTKNSEAIQRASIEADEVIMGCGNPPRSRDVTEYNELINGILNIVGNKHKHTYSIGITKKGYPRHPRVWYMRSNPTKNNYSRI